MKIYLENEIKKVKDEIIENYKSQLGLDKLQFSMAS